MEYRSRMELMGIPLVHVRFREPGDSRHLPPAAKGWIAIGDVAVGVLFAGGGLAVGTIAVGGAAVGLLSIGGCALGGMALGGASAGWWALGGLAIGAEAAMGGLALAGKVALGGLAIAGEAAAGGEAHAPAVGETAVRATLTGHPFFRWGLVLVRHSRWLLLLPILLPLALGWRKLTRQEEPPAG